MNVMKPCLLNVSGIPNSKIIRASVRVGRNNAIKTAELTLYQASPPANITITYGQSNLFTGRLESAIKQPCGRIIARYSSDTGLPPVEKTTAFFSRYFYLYRYSEYIAKDVNDAIAFRTRNLTDNPNYRPVPENALLPPGGYFYRHPNVNWEWYMRIWYFAGTKNALTQTSPWTSREPFLQDIGNLSGVLNSIFGGFNESDVIVGAFVSLRERINYSNWYLLRALWKPYALSGVEKAYCDTFADVISTYDAEVIIMQRPLSDVADILQTLGLNPAGQTQKPIKEIILLKNASLLEFIRRYCKGVVVRDGNVYDTLNITTTHTLSESNVFEYSLPFVRLVNVVIEYPASVSSIQANNIIATRAKTFQSAIDTVRIQTQDFHIQDDTFMQRLTAQVLEDAQRTGNIRTVLLPQVQAYDKVSFLGGTFKVVGFTHEFSDRGAFTNLEIIPDTDEYAL